jgi:hypothetical protein
MSVPSWASSLNVTPPQGYKPTWVVVQWNKRF